MLIDNINQDSESFKTYLSSYTGLIVACYCAEWCGTCKSYRARFAELSIQFPQHLFVWIDIEDNPDLLDDIDVENFPTLLIQQVDAQTSIAHNHFFGTMIPHIGHLERLILSVEEKIDQQRSSASVPGPGYLSDLIT
ncbi:thioredoxin family protein [Pelistega europaea]|uniref:Thioredoxin family protein n=1 Tax=Pelistega europaea TaxID=106147 RepID=A0A7Y4LA09_9BURK|nr:thioredoxin domain-containing protein [Pelistega europaea]NOL49759.1 thioredoxin family protein [Pelistega europaea]